MDSKHDPSALSLKHEREIQALQSGLNAVSQQLTGIEKWMGEFQGEMRKQFSGLTQRNPMVYVGIGTLLMGIVATASALTIFTINGQLTPVSNAIDVVRERVEKLENQYRVDFELLIRHDERMKLQSAQPKP